MTWVIQGSQACFDEIERKLLSKPQDIMRLCKTIFVISVIFFNKVASEERDDEESTLKLTEKQPPVRAFTAAELSKYDGSNVSFHTTLYGSAASLVAGCRSIQKTCALRKHGLTSKNTQSLLTYFCKSNINQTFTNGSVMI